MADHEREDSTPYEKDQDIHSFSRRSFLKLGGGTAAVAAMAGGGWALSEIVVDEGPVQAWYNSVCRYCGTGCSLMLGMGEDGQLVRVRGNKNAHNKGVICIKGSTLDFLMKNKEGRVTSPMIRRNGQLEEASWEEAMELVAAKFREAIAEYGPESVAFYGSGQLLIEESYTANKLFKAGIGSNNIDGNPRLCMASAAFGYTQTFGMDEPPGAYEDIDHADVFFLIGSNTYECHPPLWERISIRRKMNPAVKVIVVDPRRTPTAERADYYLPVVPGTDMLLLNAMMYTILEDGLYDEDFISKHVNFSDGSEKVSFEDFREFLQDYIPENVAAELGISASQIREVAYYFASAGATMSMWTMGINQRVQGTFLNNNLNSLHLITGQIGRPGATPLSLTGQSNACGGVRDTGSLAHLLPNGRKIVKENDRREVEKLWGIPEGTINPQPGYDALSLFKAMNEGKVKVMLNMCTNPAQSLPNRDQYLPGMEQTFMVVAETYRDTATAQYADVLLPAALYIEKEGTYGQTERRYQIIQKLQEPYGQSRSDLWILVDLAERLGHGDLISAKTSAEVWEEYRHFSAHSAYNFEGITRERMIEQPGIQWPCPDVNHPGTVRRYVPGDPFVPEGKEHHFYGYEDGKAVVFLRPYVRTDEKLSPQRPMYLTTGRVISQWHTGTMTGRVEALEHASGPGTFRMHPQDAARMRLQNGDQIKVNSSRGEMEGVVEINHNETPGVIFAPFYDPEFMVNNVVSDDFDPISKEPDYKTTAVSVSKVEDLSNL
jgi:nitrate reductase NapA